MARTVAFRERVKHFFTYLTKDRKQFMPVALETCSKLIKSDRLYLKLHYKYSFGKKLNLEAPTTYNEKIQWLKLYCRKPIFTKMVDKH